MATAPLSPADLLVALDTLAPECARLANGADAVLGVRPAVAIEPVTEEQLAEALAYANREGLKVLPRGGGTQMRLGYPPSGADVILSLGGLDGVLEHAPHDQTVTVQAGISLGELQVELAKTGQWLALDPLAGPNATLGGLLSTNASGARRLRYGALRDQVLGVRVALPDGTLIKGGGKVVKNVAGYDLPKLYTGALGTLGVIVAATFRLYPLPAASRTRLIRAANVAMLNALARRIAASTLVPSAMDILGSTPDTEPPVLAVRFESGVAEAVGDQLAGLRAMLGGEYEAGAALDDVDESDFWDEASGRIQQKPEYDGAWLRVRASLPPASIPAWIVALSETGAHLTARWRAHAGHGAVLAYLEGEAGALVAAVPPLRAAAERARGSLVVEDLAEDLAGKMDPWGAPPALAAMRRVKHEFDPENTLNPGRYVGGI